VPKRKKVQPETEVTVWPSSYPDDLGSIAPSDSSVDSDELGRHFMSDTLDSGHARHAQWEDEIEEPYFDIKQGDEILRSFGLKPMPRRTTTRPIPHPTEGLPRMAAPRLPQDFEEYIRPDNDMDLTDQTIRDVSLMDHEAEESGEVESPRVTTDDVHTHGKRRGGHASFRPEKQKRRA
jgi:hypothetical protein